MRDILNHCNVPYCTQIALKYLTYVQHLFYVNNACKKGQFKVIVLLINKQFKAFLRYQFECLTCEWNDSFWFLRKCTVIGSKLQMNVSWIQSKWHFQACSLYSYNKCNHRNAGAMRCILQKSFLHPLHYISPQKTYYTNWIFLWVSFLAKCWSPISPFGSFEGAKSTVECIAVKSVGIHIHPSFVS